MCLNFRDKKRIKIETPINYNLSGLFYVFLRIIEL